MPVLLFASCLLNGLRPNSMAMATTESTPLRAATAWKVYQNTLGGHVLSFLEVLQELVAFAVITLGVTLTKFNHSRRVVHPLIFSHIWRGGIRLLPMVGFLGLALGLVIISQTV